jgi:hypothetical protein
MLLIRGKGNGVSHRHNNVAAELVELGEIAGVRGVVNAKEGHTYGLSPTSHVSRDYRPGDLYLVDFSMCCDVAIVSPLSDAKSTKQAVRYPGLLIDEKEIVKHSLYDNVISLHAKAFKTFVADTAGFINKEAHDVLLLFSTVYARTRGIAFGHAHSIITRRASFIIMKQIALQVHSYITFGQSQVSA